jgi:hypothetical protein
VLCGRPAGRSLGAGPTAAGVLCRVRCNVVSGNHEDRSPLTKEMAVFECAHARRHGRSACLLSRNLGPLFAAILLVAVTDRTNAQCNAPSVMPERWCSQTDIPIYWGFHLTGTCPIDTPEGAECQRWRFAIRAVMQEFNATVVTELETPLFLYEAGDFPLTPLPGIEIQTSSLNTFDGCVADEDNARLGFTHNSYASASTSALRAIVGSKITLNSSAPWGTGGFDRRTVARHELMHALGVGHARGGLCLMSSSGLKCGDQFTLDGSALDPLRCLYGDLFSSCSTSYGIGIANRRGNSLGIFVGACDCSGSGCVSSRSKITTLAALTYEFAISESGGPYDVFATIQESELVNHEYAHDFAQSYQHAMVRLRVLDGGAPADSAFLYESISIPDVSTATPPPVTGPEPLRLLSAPNPFTSQTILSFALPVEETVEVAVYDVSGRRVATLHSGRWEAGKHEIAWSGRSGDGERVASGIYRCVLRTDAGSVTGTLVKLR